MNQRHTYRRKNIRRYRGGSQPRENSFEEKVKRAEVRVKAESNQPSSKLRDYFHKFARKTSDVVGSPASFSTAIIIIVVWACLGPAFGYSDTWQLVINTATTIVTFLMVFLIQNTQNRDARAIHLKLDELLHAVGGARNRLISLEELSDEEMDRLQKEFERVRKKAPPEKCEDKKNTAE